MMQREKLIIAFATALGISAADVNEDLAYAQIPQWDSVAHMALIAELEREFDVMFDTDDILALSSFTIAIELLKKNGIDLSQG